MRLSHGLAVAAVLAAMVVGSGPAGLAAAATPTGATLDVVGTGSVDVVPDQATVNLGVMSRATTAAAAVADNNAAMNAVIAALESAGIAADQIRTTNFYVGPIYVTPQDKAEAATIAGFESSNSVQVDLDDTTAVGHIIDIALGAGANQVQGVGFQVKDPSAPERQAMTLAVADARQMADAMASAAGLALGPIRSISYESGGGPYPMGAYGIGGGGTPVSPGQQTVTVSVHITFDVR